MKNNTLNSTLISKFLDIIDPDKKINRETVQMQVGIVILAKTVEKIKKNLDNDQVKKVDGFLEKKDSKMALNIINYLKEIDKFEEFSVILDQTSAEVSKSYISFQINSVDENKKREIFEKFPELKNAVETV